MDVVYVMDVVDVCIYVVVVVGGREEEVLEVCKKNKNPILRIWGTIISFRDGALYLVHLYY